MLRAHPFLIFSVGMTFLFAQVAFVKEYFELHRLHHGTGIVWYSIVFFVIGIFNMLVGITRIGNHGEAEASPSASSVIGTGILTLFVSMMIQFDIWKTIGRYSFFYEQQHMSGTINAP
jgi:hypothetical protein